MEPFPKLKYIPLVPQIIFNLSPLDLEVEVGYNHKRVQLNEASQTSKSSKIKSKAG